MVSEAAAENAEQTLESIDHCKNQVEMNNTDQLSVAVVVVQLEQVVVVVEQLEVVEQLGEVVDAAQRFEEVVGAEQQVEEVVDAEQQLEEFEDILDNYNDIVDALGVDGEPAELEPELEAVAGFEPGAAQKSASQSGLYHQNLEFPFL